jgi:hypothetical protein
MNARLKDLQRSSAPAARLAHSMTMPFQRYYRQ